MSVSPNATPTMKSSEVYNIIPIHNLLADHPSLRFPEVRASAPSATSVVPLSPLGVRTTTSSTGSHSFSASNPQMSPTNANTSSCTSSLPTTRQHRLTRFDRRHLLKNYSNWCSYLSVKSNIWLNEGRNLDQRRELLYVGLFLLIWGESANLRFMPECICYIFHNMAMELNKILEDYIDEDTGRPFLPSISGENAYLIRVKAEVENSRNGTAKHSAWRNYDDLYEYFWSKRCFEKLKWPIDVGSNFFVTGDVGRGEKVGKMGFVETRSFWNLFRSFDKLWVMLVLFLQVGIIVAWERRDWPWEALETREVQVRCLTVFFTWSALRFLQSLLDIGMQYSLVSKETKSQGVRMILKSVIAAAWILVFGVFYGRIVSERNRDGSFRAGADGRIVNFLEVVIAFLAPEILATALFNGRRCCLHSEASVFKLRFFNVRD